MKILFFKVLLICSLFSYAQTSSIVVDSENNTPIAYANIWVEGENIGTTSNKMGYFNLDKTINNIVLSAVGYKTKKINTLNVKDSIYLDPEVIALKQKITKNRKKRLVIDNFLFSKINFFYGSGETPWMRGKYFPFLKRYKNTPLLKSFKIYTKSNIDSAKFNIRIYKKTNSIELQELLHKENIIGVAKKGNRLTEVDISELNISFPEEGVYIVLEWLIIESNKKIYKTLFTKTGEKKELSSYGPLVGALPVIDNKNSIVYREGQWKKPLKTPKNAAKNYRNKHSILAMELTLTD